MLTRVAQRYAIALGAFLVAAAWTGIGLTSAVECLVVFSAVYLVSAAVQARRTAAATARRPRRRRRAPYEDEDSSVWPQRDFPSAI
jgi:hypothetical protein